MADPKLSLILPFMGQTRDRFQVWGREYTLEEMVARAAQVEGVGAVEIIYPYNLSDVTHTRRLLDDHGLACSTVNVNIKAEPMFHLGSLTHRDPSVRRAAIQWMKEGMDVAPEMGCDVVTVCPLGDGHDYAFQLDYMDAWGWFVEGVREAAAHRPDVRLSLEYKPNETRVRTILGTAAAALHACQQVDLPNIGVTIDIGHSLYAGETPALSIAQLAGAGRLFVVHINDNYRNWDWDLVPGSVNFWDWIENLLYIQRVGYIGWLVSDVMPGRLDAIGVMNAVSRSLRRVSRLLERADRDALWQAICAGDALAAYDVLYAAMGLDA